MSAKLRYHIPAAGEVLCARDGRVEIPYDGLAVPLLTEDYEKLVGEPGYDEVGRGLYLALRLDPESPEAVRYASILREGYPHIVSEIASAILMLGHKDVDLPYLERKISSLKIFAAMEPENPRFPLEIGLALREKGMLLSAPCLVTTSMYQAEKYLRRSLEMDPGSREVMLHLAEVSFILGRYDEALALWRDGMEALSGEARDQLMRRISVVQARALPLVPPVDYLEGVGMAFQALEQGDVEEAAAILEDVLADNAFADAFPIAEVPYVLGLAYERLCIPRTAEEWLKRALEIDPEMEKAAEALRRLGC